MDTKDGDDLDTIAYKIDQTEKVLAQLKDQKYNLSMRINSLEVTLQELKKQENVKKLVNRPDTSHWSTTEFAWTEDLVKALKEKFKFDTFRFKQLAAINVTMSKKDCILVMPTGGGKSLTYQLPACLSSKLTLVVSPLISLISDQLIALEKLGINAATINSSTTKGDRKKIHDSMVSTKSNLRLLFVTPEWIVKSKVFFNYLSKCYNNKMLERVVIDEVHCCSTWGHDFRTDYSQLNFFKNLFPDVPILGLTATATMQVLIDVQKMLEIPEAVIITAPFNRPNLYYKVIDKPEKEETLDYLEKILTHKYAGKSGIIYAQTIKDCEDLALALKQRGLKIAPYHANLDHSDKHKVHERWLNNKYQVVVATIAFGMGIDKPDVRFVIHHSVPKSMEGLYQESGRAGRNGDKADCIVMYSLTDVLKNISMSTSATADRNAVSVLKYCLNQEKCRRELIAKHFEDPWTTSMCNSMCDICEDPEIEKKYNLKPVYDILAQVLSKSEDKLTLIKLHNAYNQICNKNGARKLEKNDIYTIIGYLLEQKYFKVSKGANLYGYIAYIDLNTAKTPGDKIVIVLKRTLRGVPRVNGQENGESSEENNTAAESQSKCESHDEDADEDIDEPPSKKLKD